MIIQWIKNITAFQNLPEIERSVLLEKTWTQLFLIHLAQWSEEWNLIDIIKSKYAPEKLHDDKSLRGLLTVKVNLCISINESTFS